MSRTSLALAAALCSGALFAATPGLAQAATGPTSTQAIAPAATLTASAPVAVYAIMHPSLPEAYVSWGPVGQSSAGWTYELSYAKGTVAADGSISFGPERAWSLGKPAATGSKFSALPGDIYRVKVVGMDTVSGKAAEPAYRILRMPQTLDLPSAEGTASSAGTWSSTATTSPGPRA